MRRPVAYMRIAGALRELEDPAVEKIIARLPRDDRLSREALTWREAGRSQKEWERMQARLEEQYGPSQSQVAHQWPDGWTVQHHTRDEDRKRIGEMMANCWKGDRFISPDMQFFSLHDPLGRPKIALDAYSGEPGKPERLGIPLGAFNTYPTDSSTGMKYLNRLTEWAGNQGYDRYTAVAPASGYNMVWPFDKSERGDPYRGGWRYEDYMTPTAGWREAVFMDEDQPGVCPTCGDPLEGTKCKRCDWGVPSPNAMTDGEPILDPTRDIKPAIQSSWKELSSD